MVTAIQQDIFRTIAFFSYFQYPLTAFEVWKWQYQPSASHSLFEVMRELRTMKEVSAHNGFYGLGDVVTQVKTRHLRFLNAVQKYKKLSRIATYLSLIPSVEGFAICNSLAIHHTRPESDIDIFVITTPERIWTTRFFAVLPFILLKMRPKETKQNPVDISFFVTNEALNVMRHKIGDEDPYLAWWVRSLVPMLGREDVFQRFVRHNAWAKLDFPNSLMPKRAAWKQTSRLRLRFLNGISESWLRWLQIKKFPNDIIDSMNADHRVVVSNDVLKFHKNDRREEILRHLYEKTRI